MIILYLRLGYANRKANELKCVFSHTLRVAYFNRQNFLAAKKYSGVPNRTKSS